MAGARRRCLLLPSRIGPLVVPLQYLHVRAGLLAQLPLLPRSCHVGHRGLHLPDAPADGTRVRLCPARVPGAAAAGGGTQRRDVRIPRTPVSVGERATTRRRGDTALRAAPGLLAEHNT